MSTATKKEIAEINADKSYWQRYESIFGWRLYGWSYRQAASFMREDGTTVNVGDSGHIRASELDKILKITQPGDGKP